MDDERKQQLRQQNEQTIQQACRRVWNSEEIQLDQPISLPLRNLFDTQTGQTMINAELVILVSEQGLSMIQIRDTHGNVIASRELLVAAKSLADNRQVTLVTDAITTSPGYEGNGLAGALMREGEHLLHKTVGILRLPSPVIHFLTDHARGHERDRTGWSSNMAKRLGFSDDSQEISRLAHLTGQHLTADEIAHTVCKVYKY